MTTVDVKLYLKNIVFIFAIPLLKSSSEAHILGILLYSKTESKEEIC